MGQPKRDTAPVHARRGGRRTRDGVEANARLTGSTAAVLLVLLAAEGATVPFIGPFLTWHVVIGMILVPPLLVKIGATGYRFVRYYFGAPAYVQKGPPPALLRLVGPFVVVVSIVLFASGIVLLYITGQWRANLYLVHRVSFILWFGAMTVHVLGHLGDTARLAPRDWYGRARRDISGAGARQWLLVASLVVGALLAVAVVGRVNWFRTSGHLTVRRAVPALAGRTDEISSLPPARQVQVGSPSRKPGADPDHNENAMAETDDWLTSLVSMNIGANFVLGVTTVGLDLC